MTLTELLLWEKLKDRKIIKAKFRRQHPEKSAPLQAGWGLEQVVKNPP